MDFFPLFLLNRPNGLHLELRPSIGGNKQYPPSPGLSKIPCATIVAFRLEATPCGYAFPMISAQNRYMISVHISI
jgi:hypothetical protein